MSWLNYHHFMYFKVIAEEGSIVKASKKLAVGQPALSAQLKNFEESLGHKLFSRENRRLVLTEAGKQALEYAKQIDMLGMEFLDSMQDQSFAETVKYQIGSLDSIPKGLIAQLVKFIQRLHPNCEVKLLEGGPADLLKKMDKFQLDLIVSNYPSMIVDLDRSYFTKTVGKYPVHLYGVQKFKKLQKNFPESLSAQPIILPTRESKLRNDIDNYFAANKVWPSAVAETQDTSLQKTLGFEGIGVVPLSDYSAQGFYKSKQIHKIASLEGVFEEYWIVAPKKFLENNITSELFNEFEIEPK